MGYRGHRHHLKRVNAPHHWMLGKLDGIWAPKPSAGPHKARNCLPLVLLLRNRLKYALNMREVFKIVKDREGQVKIDGKYRKDPNYPLGFMDVVSIDKTGDHFRLLYDVKGRFAIHKIKKHETQIKLCKVKRKGIGSNKVPYIVTHDGRTIRYPHPDIDINDSVEYNFEEGEIKSHFKFQSGNIVMLTGGNNIGRVGVITHIERHPGSFQIVHVKDGRGQTFATRNTNIFVIGSGKDSRISLPKGQGIKFSIIEERKQRIEREEAQLDEQDDEDDDDK